MLDVRKLVVLREVERAGSIAGAARALSYTRSAISQQVSALEAEAGAPLVDRTANHVVLTPAGCALVAHTEKILVELRRASASVSELAPEVAGVLRLGAPFREGPPLLAAGLDAVRRRYPAVEVQLVAVTDASGPEEVRHGRLDAALGSRYGAARPPGAGGDGDGVRELDLAEDALQLWVAPGHRLAGAPGASLADLADEPWVTVSGSPLGELVAGAARAAGYEPRSAAVVDDLGAAATLVGLGWGVAVLPALTPSGPGAPVVRLPLADLGATRRIVLVVRDGDQGLAPMALLLGALREHPPTAEAVGPVTA